MSGQDWEQVVWKKPGVRPKGVTKEQDLNQARRKGEEIITEKRFFGGKNTSTKLNMPQNIAKLDEDTGDYRVERVSGEFSRALQQARVAKKITQAQLAQMINEKVSVVNDYEAGRAIPNHALVQKMSRCLGVNLPRPVMKKKPEKIFE
ncbi:multiprotein bridging factor type 1 like transcriptional co-activator [Cryptosporidium ryanae]|uniref:multiprotein bridging factor type 1 like transcriptional co-activator n=1 Tax=Cryptosporidium ryanae TaxID=515981 RepID=UPI00351A7E12|nr:multiprotein bridging factor type 1 like transcriptional co-activator [Cryptosporidium ryanae]